MMTAIEVDPHALHRARRVIEDYAITEAARPHWYKDEVVFLIARELLRVTEAITQARGDAP